MNKLKLLAVAALLSMSLNVSADNCPVALEPGWNLVGGVMVTSMPMYAFFDEPEKIISVWKWDAVNKTWAFHSPMSAEGGIAYALSHGYLYLTGLGRNEGVWVNTSAPTTFNTCIGIGIEPPPHPQ